LTLMTGVAASRSALAYRGLRRHPWGLLIPGTILGLGAFVVGPHNAQLFLATIVMIGVTGVAVPRQVVVVAGIVAAVGLAAPQLLHGQDNLGGALVVVVPPLMYWLIIERIASFALRLHQSLLSAAPDASHSESRRSEPPDNFGRPADAGAEDRPVARPQAGLPEPRVIRVNGIHLTSRQLQVTLLACEGLRHREIAACLDIGPQQVLRHLRKAEQRTRSASTPQLVAWAQSAGLAPAPVEMRDSHATRPPQSGARL
jgi:DNA-binding CsgD family transcriptional regulator